MNKKTGIILFIGFIIISGIIAYFFIFNNNTNTNNNSYEATKTSSEENNQKNNDSTKDNLAKNDENQSNNQTKDITPKEEQIASFTTKIYDKKANRQNNIDITCNTLNGTVVKKGELFSFCDTIGQATSAKGYKEADIFDKDGNKKKGLGGRKLSNKYNFI